MIDPQIEPQEEPGPQRPTITRRVDRAGRISILKHRYHVGRHLAGQRVVVEALDGLLHVSHDGVLVATHARRHLPEDDVQMERRAAASRPARPTTGDEVLRRVDTWGSVSFAGTGYRVGNRYAGQIVGVRVVDDTVQITQDGLAAADPPSPARQAQGVRSLGQPRRQAEEERSRCRIGTGAIPGHGYRDSTAQVRGFSVWNARLAATPVLPNVRRTGP